MKRFSSPFSAPWIPAIWRGIYLWYEPCTIRTIFHVH